MLEKIKINWLRLSSLPVFVLIIISALFFLTHCTFGQQHNKEFELFLSKFIQHPLPFEIQDYNAIHNYSDTITVNFIGGWKYEKNIYQSITNEELKFLPPEPKKEPFEITYQAIYQFQTKGDFKMVLFFKELDSNNEHEEGLGVHLILVTYSNDGHILDSHPLAYLVYNIKNQIGKIDDKLRIKIVGNNYLYEQNKTQTLYQEFETTSTGKIKLVKSDTTFQELR